MKFNRLLPLAALALPLLAAARPAAPDPVDYTNPDGTVTQIRIYGDEQFSFVADIDNLNILELDARGFWRPAVRNGKVLRFSDAAIETLRAEQPQVEEVMHPAKQARMAALDNKGRSQFPTVGEHHFPVILIEFADKPWSIPDTQEAFRRLCNEENYSAYNGRGSIRDFYMACSNNKFQPTFDVYGPVKVSQTSAYYVGKGSGLPSEGKYARWGEALAEAVNAIKAQGVDFAQYDNDSDNDIDFIYFFYSGYGQADTGDENTIWPHQGDFYNYCYRLGLEEIYLDGKRFGPYACSAELRGTPPPGESHPYMDAIGAFCHEFGHVLGLPDLYDAARQSGLSDVYTKTPGIWTTMDGGSYNLNSTCPPMFSAYEQWLCKWLEFDELTLANEGIHCTLNPLGVDSRNAYQLRIQRASSSGSNPQYYNEYFVTENRGMSKWDDGLPEKGMLVWRINYNRNTWVSNRVNTGGVSNVEIIPASTNKTCYPMAGSLVNAIYPGCDGQLVPVNNSSLWRYYLTDITRNEETGVVDFDYNMITDAPEQVTVMHDNPARKEGSTRHVKLEWDECPEADSYLVTVKRYDANNREYIVDGFNEKNVGKVTACEILNISSSAWKQTMKAYVRVNNKIPAKETSNVITFVPNDLTERYTGLAVDLVSDREWEAYGLKGAIEAPEDAEIYNLNGLRTGREDLPAGVYIVRYGNDIRKVAVR